MATNIMRDMRRHGMRSETLPDPSTSSPVQKFQRHYIVVHGLRDAGNQELDYQAALERCVEDIAKRAGGSYQIQPFRFRTSLLLGRGAEEFKSAALRLFQRLNRIRQLGFLGIEQSTVYAGVEAAPSTTLSSHFIFIAHGLGSWLVKAVLANWDMSPQTLGLVFLDAPTTQTGLSSIGDYQDAVIRLRERFHNPSRSPGGKPSPISSTLPKTLWEADMRFREYRHGKLGLGQCIEGSLYPDFVNLWGAMPPVGLSPAIPDTKLSQANPCVFIFVAVRPISKLIRRRPKTVPHQDEFRKQVLDLLERPSKSASNVLARPQAGYAAHPILIPQRKSTARSDGRSSLAFTHSIGSSTGLASSTDQELRRADKRPWKNLEKEGRSFLARGQLENAGAAFTEALDALDAQGPSSDRNTAGTMDSELAVRRAEIRMQIAIIDHYRGSSDDAETCLRSLEKEIKNLRRADKLSDKDRACLNRLNREVHRWLATSLVSRGSYPDAIKELQKAVSADSDDHSRMADVTIFKAQRDLAVVYGWAGALLEAHKTVQLLEGVKKDGRPWSESFHPPEKDHERSHQRSNSEPNPFPTPVPDAGLETLWVAGLWAAAYVDMFGGKYNRALETSTMVLRWRRKSLGGRHVKTLETASLRAYLLARMSRLKEAEEECVQTVRILSEDFGPTHRHTLEATWVLVVIFRKQRRLVEAIDTGKSLSNIADRCFKNKDHPLRLRIKAELAYCYSSNGGDTEAKRLLEEVVRLSGCQLERPGHASSGHETLRPHAGSSAHGMCSEDHTLPSLGYQVKLARVEWAWGDWEVAEERAMHVLRTQRDRLGVDRAQGQEDQETEPASGKEGSSAVAFIDRVLKDIEGELDSGGNRGNSDPSDNPSQDRPSPMAQETSRTPTGSAPHGQRSARTRTLEGTSSKQHPGSWIQPSTLAALRLLAAIQFSWNPEALKRGQPFRMLRIVQRWQGKADVFGPDNPGLLTTKHEYALLLRKDEKFDLARECFKHVFVARARALGTSHPDTLSAKRELLVTNCLLGDWADPDSYIDRPEKPTKDPCKEVSKTPTKESPIEKSNTPTNDSHMELSKTPTEDSHREESNTPTKNEDHQQAETQPEGDGEPPAKEHHMSAEQWDHAEASSVGIFELHQRQLGKDHPEALNSLLWVLTVQLLLDKQDSASETRKLLESRLQPPHPGRETRLSQNQIEDIKQRIRDLYEDTK